MPESSSDIGSASDRVVVEVELVGFSAEGIRENHAAVAEDMTLEEVCAEALNLAKSDCHVVFFVAPPDKGTWDEASVQVVGGRVLRARLKEPKEQPLWP